MRLGANPCGSTLHSATLGGSYSDSRQPWRVAPTSHTSQGRSAGGANGMNASGRSPRDHPSVGGSFMSSLLRSFGITNALPAFASILPGTGGAGDVYVADQHNQRTRSSDPCLRPRRWRAGAAQAAVSLMRNWNLAHPITQRRDGMRGYPMKRKCGWRRERQRTAAHPGGHDEASAPCRG